MILRAKRPLVLTATFAGTTELRDGKQVVREKLDGAGRFARRPGRGALRPRPAPELLRWRVITGPAGVIGVDARAVRRQARGLRPHQARLEARRAPRSRETVQVGRRSRPDAARDDLEVTVGTAVRPTACPF